MTLKAVNNRLNMGKSSFIGKRNGYGCKRSVFMAYTQAKFKAAKNCSRRWLHFIVMLQFLKRAY
jgi:hypothetical protein